MASARSTRFAGYVLGAALAFGATAALAQSDTAQTEQPIVIAQAGSTKVGSTPASSTPAYPPLEAGVRKAATEGPEALRRYVHRTRMIYAWDITRFATVD